MRRAMVLLWAALVVFGCEDDPQQGGDTSSLDTANTVDGDTSSTDTGSEDSASDIPEEDTGDVSTCCESITCVDPSRQCNPATCQCDLSADATSDGSDGDTSTSGSCVGFGDGSECGLGEWCEPTARSAGSGAWQGSCEPEGSTATLGNRCRFDACSANLECVQGVCEAVCDPYTESGSGAPGACGEDRTCIQIIREDGTATVYGACLESCTPYADIDGCGIDDWCFPAYLTPNAGLCTSAEGRDEGAFCSDLSGENCGAGLLCVSGVCKRICDPYATGSEPGVCDGEEEACVQVKLGEETLIIGYCEFACDPMTQNCPRDQDACFFAELGDTGYPSCDTPQADLQIGADCAFLERFDTCGANRFCIDSVCEQLCVVSDPSEFGTANPVCPANRVCNALGSSLSVGKCE